VMSFAPIVIYVAPLKVLIKPEANFIQNGLD
jgi:hypothetical protein